VFDVYNDPQEFGLLARQLSNLVWWYSNLGRFLHGIQTYSEAHPVSCQVKDQRCEASLAKIKRYMELYLHSQFAL
jgi:hypothetical protein